jgi:hypothetical protein
VIIRTILDCFSPFSIGIIMNRIPGHNAPRVKTPHWNDYLYLSVAASGDGYRILIKINDKKY